MSAEGTRLPRGVQGAVAPALTAGMVAASALLLLAVTQNLTGWAVFSIPFVASAAVITMAPTAPLARPAAIVISYPVAVTAALVITTTAGPSVYAATSAAAVSIIVMLVLKAPHAPAVAAAAVIGLDDPGFSYLLDPLLPAIVLVVVTPLLAGRLLPRFPYAPSWR
jgi:hypothetical protein